MSEAFAAFIPRTRIEDLARTGQPHLRPIYAAMAAGAGLLMVRQRSGRFMRPDDPRFVAIVGDDTDCALGPAGFHAKSMRRLLAAARSVAIIASDIEPAVYATAAAGALLGLSSVIVETRPEQEGAWLDLAKREVTSAALLLVTPMEGSA